MICPICNQHVPIDSGNDHLKTHFLAGQAAIVTINGRSHVYATKPAIINNQTKATSPTVSPALAWMLECCQEVSEDALDEFMKL